jgi:hypothetical protein
MCFLQILQDDELGGAGLAGFLAVLVVACLLVAFGAFSAALVLAVQNMVARIAVMMIWMVF